VDRTPVSEAKAMSGPAEDLFAADGRVDVAITAWSADFASELGTVLRALQTRINALVLQMEREGGRVVATQASLGIAQKAKAQLEQALVQAGYQETVTAAYARMPQLVALSSVAEKVQAFSAFDLQVLDAFRVLKTTELMDLFDTATTKASGILLRGVMGAQNESELISELAEILDETSAHATTLYETGLSEFTRTHELLHTDGTPDEAFLYSGPIDGRIRPFCLERVGKVYTRAAIDAMDNGQLANSLITAGGWRCRHIWRAVSKFSDLQDKAGTGEYATPRAEAQVEHVTQALKAAKDKRLRRAA
jgi:hypothetical protein